MTRGRPFSLIFSQTNRNREQGSNHQENQVQQVLGRNMDSKRQAERRHTERHRNAKSEPKKGMLLLGLLVVSAVACRSALAFSPTSSRLGSSRTKRARPSTGSFLDDQASLSLLSSTALPCQLLGMNCASPTQFAVSWPGFCDRGGKTDIHADGWGLAYYEGQGLRQFHDVEAASTSPLAQFLGQQQIKTCNMLAHIRYATAGETNLANVHPFAREMWGINWCFCHNGEVPLFKDHPDRWIGEKEGERVYFPVGSTDSEAAFCALLNALRAQFPDTMPSLPVLYESLQKLCQEIVDYDEEGTIFNFLLSCGPHVLWVHSYPGRRPGGQVWNGLHYTVRGASTNLCDEDVSIDVSLNAADSDDQVCIVATSPLTLDEEWIELKKGELILLDEGLPRVSTADLFRVELHGHGLQSNRAVLQPPRLEEDMRRYHFDPSFFVAGGI